MRLSMPGNPSAEDGLSLCVPQLTGARVFARRRATASPFYWCDEISTRGACGEAEEDDDETNASSFLCGGRCITGCTCASRQVAAVLRYQNTSISRRNNYPCNSTVLNC